MSSKFQETVLNAIKEFFWYKHLGNQNYSQSIGQNLEIHFTSVLDTIVVSDPIFGVVRDLTLSYTISLTGKKEVQVTSIPFNPDQKFIKAIAWYVEGLVDSVYTFSIEYSTLEKEFCNILSEYSAINQESEHGYGEDYPMDILEAIMAIAALPDPIEAEEYLKMVENPLAGLTEQKSWYSRPDPKRFAKVKRRSKFLRSARQIKNEVLYFKPNFVEFDDYAY